MRRADPARPRWLLLLGAFTALAMLAAACDPDTEAEDPAAVEEPAIVGEDPDTTPDEEPDPDAEEPDTEFVTGFSYNIGIFSDPTTTNFWNYLAIPEVWTAYVISPTKPSLYSVSVPIREGEPAGGQVVPDLAVGLPPEPEQDGDVWVVEVEMRDDATWSDGEPITAHDVVFTWQTAIDFGLGGNWLSYVPRVEPDNPDATGIAGLEAVDDHTLRIEFNNRPGLPIWPHAVGTVAPVLPEHFWAEHVEEAAAAGEAAEGEDDPRHQTLFAVDGAGEPSGGSVTYVEREPGAFLRNEANERYHDRGTEVTLYEDGAVREANEERGTDETFHAEGDSETLRYTVGPFLGDQNFSLYGDQSAAVLALQQGEVDYLLNPLGLQPGLRDQVIADEDLEAIVNPTNGHRYLAFNLRNFPMSELEFRQALTAMIDREFMAESVLQGVAFPLYTHVPSGNAAWYNEDFGEQQRQLWDGRFDDMVEEAQGTLGEGESYTTEAARLETAVQILSDAGWTWDSEPSYDRATDAITPGEGLRGPDGQEIPALELLAPGPGYDPLRATYAVWIEQWASQLGVPLRANPTSFDAIVPRIQDPEAFDMYILGWSLGSPALPTFHESFFHSRNVIPQGNNNPGFSNPEFDQLADAFLASADEEQAYELMWQMEEILAEELPYVILFDTPILEFYRASSVAYPYTETLGGLQFQQGVPGLVMGVE